MPIRILCVCYDSLALNVEMLLLHGASFITYAAQSNKEAQRLLANQSFDVVVIGCHAPLQLRNEMAVWVNQRHPTPIVALVEMSEERVALAEHNVSFTDPGKWLNCMRKFNPQSADQRLANDLASGGQAFPRRP